jgi:predicted alpha/beta hydrolase family esterase
MAEIKKRILVMHGWNSSGSEYWFSEVKSYFESKGYGVTIPELPGNYFPDFKGWMKAIADFAPTENDILIGHSLGGATILRYLEIIENPVGHTILTATPINSMGFNQVDNFFEIGFDWEIIKNNAGKINLIYEEDDTIVPLDHGQTLAKELNAPIEIIPGGLHLYRLDMKLLEKMINE